MEHINVLVARPIALELDECALPASSAPSIAMKPGANNKTAEINIKSAPHAFGKPRPLTKRTARPATAGHEIHSGITESYASTDVSSFRWIFASSN